MDYSSEEEDAVDFGQDELQEIEYAFSKFATVLDEQQPQGVISVHDIEYLLRDLGASLTEAEIFVELDEFDPENTGVIDFKTFLLILKKNLQPMNEDDLKLCFVIFDKDGNGHIGTREIKYVTSHLGKKYTEEEIDDMLKEVDADGDGRINFEDFVYFMTRK
ncbi:calmodulin-A-like [Coccinella septempunctata]|uniref:calmodulin-A-like n=1 Tax=Coccinella septempunctata TaxID=41139 RepID=UPI001D09372D|nr:calmodulin-A-like [Coccinella septempunctata]